MSTIKHPAMRYHGGKWRLAPWILQQMPPHSRYVEPFGGAGSVLLQKPRCYAEVYNDLDGDVVSFFRVLREPTQRSQLLTALALTPYARAEFVDAWEPNTDPVERARRLCIRAQMGFGSAGATKGITGFRIDTRRSYGTAQHLWASFPDNLQAIGNRLAGVLIEQREAIQVMQDHDCAETLHFVDPPYVTATRCRARVQHLRYYRHEMTDQQHIDLLASVDQLRGMVMLCGYASPLYTERLAHWSMRQKRSRISAGRGTALRTECLWLNPAAQAALGDAAGLALEVAA